MEGTVGMELVCRSWLYATCRNIACFQLATVAELLEIIGFIVMIHALACHLD